MYLILAIQRKLSMWVATFLLSIVCSEEGRRKKKKTSLKPRREQSLKVTSRENRAAGPEHSLGRPLHGGAHKAGCRAGVWGALPRRRAPRGRAIRRKAARE